jgi:hypothetical protein
MSDLYKEILVKPDHGSADSLKKGLVIAGTVLVCAAGILIHPLILLAGAILIFLDYMFILPRFDVEYEYLYVNGDIDIDVIYSKMKRKRMASFEKANLLLMAPTGSDHLTDYRQKDIKLTDYSSMNPKEKTWTLYYGDEKSTSGVILSLPDEIASDMRRYAPRQVFLQ